MQLIRGKAAAQTPTAPALRLTLAAATAALLAPAQTQAQTPPPAPGPTSAAAAAPGAWLIDSAVLVYKEGGGRVSAVEPVVAARRTDGNGRTLGLKLTLDALTGASPNGAVPQPTPQTFTSPSGESHYTVPARSTPLDPGFRDQRVALAVTHERPWGARQRLALGGNVSAEHDFTSLSVNAALARDYNDKNTTLSLGLALEADRGKAVGGMPAGLRPAMGNVAPRTGSESRSVIDLLAGLTQVMHRRWLMQVNVGLGRSRGSHDDPYKVLSVVDGSSGLLAGDHYVSESRPDRRNRLSVYWQNKVHLTQDVVDVAYRYYRDDWGLQAHTFDLRYRYELGAGMHLEPHARLYRQGAADFWRGWLVEGSDWVSAGHRAQVAHASADPRLAAFAARTLGLKLGAPLGRGGEFSLRLEAYRQQPQTPAGAPGVLQTLNLAPTLKATTLLVGYTFSY
jgi:hypothetical protein